MKYQPIYVYGASGHGKVVADILLAAKLPVKGFIDDDPARQGGKLLGLPVAGEGDWLRRKAKSTGIGVALGIGDNHARRAVAERCLGWGLRLVTAIHPAAAVARSARLGPGTVVMAGAAINPDARLGAGVIVNTGAVVEHDCIVGDYAHLSPNAALGGAAQVGNFAHLGLGAVVLPGIGVGSETIVGAGAVVVRQIPDGVIAVGVPARVQRRAGRSGSESA